MVQQEHSAYEAPQEGFAHSPIRASGCRRVTLEMRAWLDRADSFKGLPAGTAKPLTVLYAFKEAEPYLGLPAHTYKLVDWLVRFTQPQDWEEGSRPIAWPEARRQEEFLGLSTRQTQALNRALQEAGIFVMRDDPQGRRYGHRDPKTGRITKAFGFDLSLLMERHKEFKKIATEAQIERNRMKKLRQQKTLARKAIGQAAEELSVQGYDSEALQCLRQEADELIKAGSHCHRSGDLAMVVQSLKRQRDEIQRMLSDLIKPVETAPMGAKNSTHSTATTLTNNDKNHTVTTARNCNASKAPPVLDCQGQPKPKHLFPESLHITPATLVELAPRLAPYMPARTNDKNWQAVVEAALFLSGEMGINYTLWSRACDLMGREYAAVAVAIVSTRPAEHFTKSAGSYFGGMVKKFEKNPHDLCLSRTLWQLKEQIWGKEGHKERRELEKTRRKSFNPVMVSSGSFRPDETVPPPRTAAMLMPPPHPVLPVPVDSAAASFGNSRAWRPSPALLEEARQVGLRMRQQQQHLEDVTKSTFAKPEDGTPSPAAPDRDKG